MKPVTKTKMEALQNLGWIDRIIRFIIGSIMIASAMAWLSSGSQADLAYYLIIISIYPFLTSIIGVDPIYRLLDAHSCGASDRNPCGTFPYEVKKAVKGKHRLHH